MHFHDNNNKTSVYFLFVFGIVGLFRVKKKNQLN